MKTESIPTYKKWLTQFDIADKNYAKLLVESLTYYSTDFMMNSMSKQLEAIIQDIEGNIALFTVRDSPKKEDFNNITYFPTDKNTQPDRINNKRGTGSEGEIAHFIRDFCKRHNNCLDHPSINKMINKNVRQVFLINDTGISGDQIQTFFTWFYSSKTIKSWNSYKLIKISTFVFAITEEAEHLLKRTKGLFSIHNCLYCENGYTKWPEKTTKRIIQLCNKYGQNLSKKISPLGYNDSFNLTILSHKCPNNTPLIIWCDRNNWNPLIEPRPNTNFSYNENDVNNFIQELFNKLGRLIKKTNYLLKPETKYSIVILKLIYKNRRYNEKYFSKYLGLNRYQLNYYLTELQNFNWIDKNNNITPQGKKTVNYLTKGKKNRNTQSCIDENAEIYYPKSLWAPD